jgi:phosphate-selective porin OprO/OprP
MYFSKLVFRAHFLVASILVGAALPSPSMGQGLPASTGSSGKAGRTARPDNPQRAGARRARGTGDEIERLRTEMGALQALITDQRQAMSVMQKQLDDIQAGRVLITRGASTAADLEPTRRSVTGAPAVTASPAGSPLAATTPESETAVSQPNTTATCIPGSAGSIFNVEPATRNRQPSTESGTPAAATAGVATGRSSLQAQSKRGLLAGWGDDHAFIRNETGSFETDFTGYSQLDFRGYSAGNHPPNTFVVRRARMAMEGRIDRYFEWRIEGDFADTNSTLLRDFYVNIHRIDEFVMRFGQTREPFSQEEMRSDNFQEFVERSLANNLAPSRSPGVMAYGRLGKGLVEYQIGAFNGKGLLALNNNGTPDTALRLRFNPWKRSDSFWIKGLIFGGAYSQGRNFNGQSIKGITESQITFFQPDTVNGRLYRANGEVTWLLGPATLRAEYDQSNQLRENLGPGGTNLPGVLAKGYMVQFTYTLTGESTPDIGYLVPKRSLFDRGPDGRTGLGAWALKFRYDNLQIIDGTPNSNRADTFYFGPNWYMNRYVRYLLDFGFERFRHPATLPRPGQHFFTVLTQVQLQL